MAIKTIYPDESTGELAALIPWDIAEKLGLDSGSKIEVTFVDGAIVIKNAE